VLVAWHVHKPRRYCSRALKRQEYRYQHLTGPAAGASLCTDADHQRIAALRAGSERPARDLAVLDALEAWGDALLVTSP